jgi:hypothetical protein
MKARRCPLQGRGRTKGSKLMSPNLIVIGNRDHEYVDLA